MMRKDHYTDIDWPLQPHGAIQLNCSLTPGQPGFAKIAKEWQKIALDVFQTLLGEIRYHEVHTLQEVWSEVSI